MGSELYSLPKSTKMITEEESNFYVGKYTQLVAFTIVVLTVYCMYFYVAVLYCIKIMYKS